MSTELYPNKLWNFASSLSRNLKRVNRALSFLLCSWQQFMVSLAELYAPHHIYGRVYFDKTCELGLEALIELA